ncbi:SAM-dependent methyltransferase, partial [Eggerthella lenta]|nr:SAM-dependent methyltransferase [Eggerthella lenta]
PGSVHNWEALAASASTLVFVMGMKNLPDIARNLLEAGMDPHTPAALIYRGTTPYQRSLVDTLARLPQAAVEAKFTNPSV